MWCLSGHALTCSRFLKHCMVTIAGHKNNKKNEECFIANSMSPKEGQNGEDNHKLNINASFVAKGLMKNFVAFKKLTWME